MAGELKIRAGTKLRMALDVPIGEQPKFNMICTFVKSLDVVSFLIVDADSVLVRREALRDKEKTASVPKPDATLMDYLESLSPKEQHTALVHLSILWAQRYRAKSNGRDGE